MLKSILKLDGAQELSKNEQEKVNGGWDGCCYPASYCCSFYGDIQNCADPYPAGCTYCFSSQPACI